MLLLMWGYDSYHTLKKNPNTNMNPNDKFNRTTLKEDKIVISESLSSIKSNFNSIRKNQSKNRKTQKFLSKFKSFENYNNVILFDSYELTKTKNRFELIILSINSTVEVFRSHQIDRESLTELEFVGLISLKKNFGNVYIRPESLVDKINELSNPIEVDFEDNKQFSRKYFVVTDNEEKLRDSVTPEFLQAITKHKGLEIEIKNYQLMARLKKRISISSIKTITELLTDIAELD